MQPKVKMLANRKAQSCFFFKDIPAFLLQLFRGQYVKPPDDRIIYHLALHFRLWDRALAPFVKHQSTDQDPRRQYQGGRQDQQAPPPKPVGRYLGGSSLRRHPSVVQQGVRRDFQRPAQLGQVIAGGNGQTVFPLGDGLPGDVYLFRQRFL